MPLYFAYGSNMDRDAMAYRCPSSRALAPATLMRHRFVLMREGYASVTRDPHCSVHGLLWALALSDVAALDRYEGVDQGLYRKIVQPVTMAAGARRALVYIGANAGPGRPLPGYMEGVVTAAGMAGLPSSYVAALRQFLPGRGHG